MSRQDNRNIYEVWYSIIYVPLVKALLTLSFSSVRYVWTTWLTTILKFSKLASDGWEYSLSKRRIVICRYLEIIPVILSEAKGLARRAERSFASLRMTATRSGSHPGPPSSPLPDTLL